MSKCTVQQERVQHARNVFADWRARSTQHVWTLHNPNESGDWLVSTGYGDSSVAEVLGFSGDAALIVGLAGNPALHEAIDTILEWGTGHQSGHADRIALAILEADEEMNRA